MPLALVARRLFSSSLLASAVFGHQTAMAEVCTTLQPGSCHSIGPNAAQGVGGPGAAVLSGYTPIAFSSGEISLPATDATGPASQPGLQMTSSAGVWGSEGREPMALAVLDYSYFPVEGEHYLRQPTTSFEWECSDHPFCFDDGSIMSTAGATLKRRYRATRINAAPLPAAVTSIPFLVDYEISIYQTGERDHEEGIGSEVFLASGSVGFGPFVNVGGGWLYHGDIVSCMGSQADWQCSLSVPNKGSFPAEARGTIRTIVALAADTLTLQVTANLRRSNDPRCRPRDQFEDSPCLVEPWGGSAHVFSDPYVYIDPDWEYASWFKVEMAADETDTTWVVPQRTSVDPETLTLGTSGEGGYGGTAGSGGASGEGGAAQGSGGENSNVPGGMGANSSGAGAPGAPPVDQTDSVGCGCHVPGTPPSKGTGWLLLLAAVALVKRRLRSTAS